MIEKETIWCVCRYTPVELFTGGFGCGCLRLDPSRSSFDCADSCAHPNLCGFGKGVIEEVTEKNIRCLVLTDCCDVMRRVCDVLQQEAQIEFIHLLPLPHRCGEREKALFAGALNELIREWGLCCDLAFDARGFLKAWVECGHRFLLLEMRPVRKLREARAVRPCRETRPERPCLPKLTKMP